MMNKIWVSNMKFWLTFVNFVEEKDAAKIDKRSCSRSD